MKFEDYKDNDNVDLIEKQTLVHAKLMELQRIVSGQRIDEVRYNYDLRAEMAKNRTLTLKYEYCTIVDAVCVKYIYDLDNVPIENYWRCQDSFVQVNKNLPGYVTTFRIKRSKVKLLCFRYNI